MRRQMAVLLLASSRARMAGAHSSAVRKQVRPAIWKLRPAAPVRLFATRSEWLSDTAVADKQDHSLAAAMPASPVQTPRVGRGQPRVPSTVRTPSFRSIQPTGRSNARWSRPNRAPAGRPGHRCGHSACSSETVTPDNRSTDRSISARKLLSSSTMACRCCPSGSDRLSSSVRGGAVATGPTGCRRYYPE